MCSIDENTYRAAAAATGVHSARRSHLIPDAPWTVVTSRQNSVRALINLVPALLVDWKTYHTRHLVSLTYALLIDRLSV